MLVFRRDSFNVLLHLLTDDVGGKVLLLGEGVSTGTLDFSVEFVGIFLLSAP